MEKRYAPTGKTVKGQLLKAENGTEYFIYGNSRIKVSEHFAREGKPLKELIEDVIQHTASHTAS